MEPLQHTKHNRGDKKDNGPHNSRHVGWRQKAKGDGFNHNRVESWRNKKNDRDCRRRRKNRNDVFLNQYQNGMGECLKGNNNSGTRDTGIPIHQTGTEKCRTKNNEESLLQNGENRASYNHRDYGSPNGVECYRETNDTPGGRDSGTLWSTENYTICGKDIYNLCAIDCGTLYGSDNYTLYDKYSRPPSCRDGGTLNGNGSGTPIVKDSGTSSGRDGSTTRGRDCGTPSVKDNSGTSSGRDGGTTRGRDGGTITDKDNSGTTCGRDGSTVTDKDSQAYNGREECGRRNNIQDEAYQTTMEEELTQTLLQNRKRSKLLAAETAMLERYLEEKILAGDCCGDELDHRSQTPFLPVIPSAAAANPETTAKKPDYYDLSLQDKIEIAVDLADIIKNKIKSERKMFHGYLCWTKSMEEFMKETTTDIAREKTQLEREFSSLIESKGNLPFFIKWQQYINTNNTKRYRLVYTMSLENAKMKDSVEGKDGEVNDEVGSVEQGVAGTREELIQKMKMEKDTTASEGDGRSIGKRNYQRSSRKTLVPIDRLVNKKDDEKEKFKRDEILSKTMHGYFHKEDVTASGDGVILSLKRQPDWKKMLENMKYQEASELLAKNLPKGPSKTDKQQIHHIKKTIDNAQKKLTTMERKNSNNDENKMISTSHDIEKKISTSQGIDKKISSHSIDKKISSHDIDKKTSTNHGIDKKISTSHGIDKKISTSHGIDKKILSHSIDKKLSSHGIDKKLSSHGIDKKTSTSQNVDKKLSTSHDVDRTISTSHSIDIKTSSHGREKNISSSQGIDKKISSHSIDKKISSHGIDKKISSHGREKNITSQGIEKKNSSQGVDKKISTSYSIDRKISNQDVDRKISNQDVDRKISNQDVDRKISTSHGVEKKISTSQSIDKKISSHSIDKKIPTSHSIDKKISTSQSIDKKISSHGIDKKIPASHSIEKKILSHGMEKKISRHDVGRNISTSQGVDRKISTSHGVDKKIPASHSIYRKISSHSIDRKIPISYGMDKKISSYGIDRNISASPDIDSIDRNIPTIRNKNGKIFKTFDLARMLLKLGERDSNGPARCDTRRNTFTTYDIARKMFKSM
ncbi:hypothetical protein Ahia01_001066400 [Argonauta hians]